MSGSIIHAQAGQAVSYKTPGDTASTSAGSGDQAWRREIERAQACAWFSMPAVGAGAEGSGHASRAPSQDASAAAKAVSWPRSSSAAHLDPPHRNSGRTEAATALPQRHEPRLALSAEVSRASAADVDATANLLWAAQRPTSRNTSADHVVDSGLPTPVAATILHTTNMPATPPLSGPASRSAVPSQPRQADEGPAPTDQAAKHAGTISADDRSPVRLSLALQGNVARLWLGIDEHVRPHLSQIVSSTIKDLNAKGITVDRLVCNGEEITGTGVASGRRKSAEQPQLSHLDRGEP